MRPLAPRRLRAVAPARGTSGRAGRTLAAVALTLQDFERELASTGVLTGRGGGLRAGRYTTRGSAIALRGFSFVPGVRVDGRLVGDKPRRAGRLRVSGRGAAAGTVELRAGRVLEGRLGGWAVRMRFRSPKVF